jgi:hypothetical protein
MGIHQLLSDLITDHHVPCLALYWHLQDLGFLHHLFNSKLFASFLALIKVASASILAAWTLSLSSANFYL